MLLTGVDNHRNGVGNLLEAMPSQHVGKPGYQGSLNQRVVTVASLLQDSGYRTYIAGKWNVGSEPYNLPNQRGFDKSIVQGDTGSDNWVPSQRYLPHSAKVNWFEDGKPANMPPEYYSSEFFVDRTLAYIDADPRKDKPFFAYLGFSGQPCAVAGAAQLHRQIQRPLQRWLDSPARGPPAQSGRNGLGTAQYRYGHHVVHH